MARMRRAIVRSCALLASLAITSGAPAQQAKIAATSVRLDANGELLVRLMGTPAPRGLDARANARLNSIIAMLKRDDVEGALAAWKTFLETHARQLGRSGVARTGQWLVRVASVEPVPELSSPADRIRYARDASARMKEGLAALQGARQDPDKSGRVKVKLPTMVPYRRLQPGTREVAADLTPGQVEAEVTRIEKDLDSMSEMGEMESLRLQSAVDRMSRTMSTVSNLLKKISDTSQSITQNLK